MLGYLNLVSLLYEHLAPLVQVNVHTLSWSIKTERMVTSPEQPQATEHTPNPTCHFAPADTHLSYGNQKRKSPVFLGTISPNPLVSVPVCLECWETLMVDSPLWLHAHSLSHQVLRRQEASLRLVCVYLCLVNLCYYIKVHPFRE